MIQIEYLPIVLTGIGIIVSILYYTSVLRNANETQKRALETRRAQLFMNLYNNYGLEHRNATLAVRAAHWADFDDFWENYSAVNNREFSDHVGVLWRYFTGIAVMLQQNYLDIEIVEPICGGYVLEFWEKMSPVMGGIREKWNAPRAFAEAEYLYNELSKYYNEHPELKPIR